MIIFGSVRFLSKKVTKPKLFFLKKKPKPNRNRVKPTGFGSVRFLGQKPVQTGLARFFFWFFVGFGSVRFFQFFSYKTEPAGFFKNLIGFFSVRFFRLFFFPVFSI